MDYNRFQKIRKILRQKQPDLTVITENVHLPYNLSAIMRTCEAVAMMEVNIVNNVSEIFIDNKVTAGAQKWLMEKRHPDIKTGIDYLRQQGFIVYAAHFSDRSIDYTQIDYTKSTAILLGEERKGVSLEAAELVDDHISIPMMGMTQSLNVSVAAAVILFEAHKQRLKQGFYDQLRIPSETYEKMIFEWAYPEVANSYQAHHKPYPPLNDNGDIIRQL